MHRLNIIDDFEEVRSVARVIDEGMVYLDQKLSELSRFGLSLKQDESRSKAENLLSGMKEELDYMKSNVDSCIEEQRRILEDTIADNKSIKDYVDKTRREINELEDILRLRKDYQPYEPEKPDEDSIANDTDSSAAEPTLHTSFEELSYIGSSVTCPDFHLKETSSLLNSSIPSLNSPRIFNCRASEKKSLVDRCFSNDINLSCNKLLKPKKLNTTDDTLKTPGKFSFDTTPYLT